MWYIELVQYPWEYWIMPITDITILMSNLYVLTHWHQRDMAIILIQSFSNWYQGWIHMSISCETAAGNVTWAHWWLVNIDSGNGLWPSGNKPLPEPMLTQIYHAIWHHLAPMSLSPSSTRMQWLYRIRGHQDINHKKIATRQYFP